MGGKGSGRRPGADRKVLAVRIDPERAEWLDDEADDRMVGKGKLVEIALDLLRDHLESNHPLPRSKR